MKAMPRQERERKPEEAGVVYLLICKATRNVYVGSTTVFARRKAGHLGALRAGKHSSPKLQAEFARYGEGSMVMAPVERGVDLNFLLAREQFWMWRMEGRLLNASDRAFTLRSRHRAMLSLAAATIDELKEELARRGA